MFVHNAAAFPLALLALVSSSDLVYGQPSHYGTQDVRLGGGPNNSPVGTVWMPEWTDATIPPPRTFSAATRGGCGYDITFEQDAMDDRYERAYFALYSFGSGDFQRQEEKRPSTVQPRGDRGNGPQTYHAHIADACSAYYSDRRKPDGFKVYFTPRRGQGNTGYSSPAFGGLNFAGGLKKQDSNARPMRSW